MSDELEQKWRKEFEEIEGTDGSHRMVYYVACSKRHAEASALRAENARLRTRIYPQNHSQHLQACADLSRESNRLVGESEPRF